MVNQTLSLAVDRQPSGYRGVVSALNGIGRRRPKITKDSLKQSHANVGSSH